MANRILFIIVRKPFDDEEPVCVCMGVRVFVCSCVCVCMHCACASQQHRCDSKSANYINANNFRVVVVVDF